MNKDEALKLALEFIDQINKYGWKYKFEAQMYEAIDAIKEALAQPDTPKHEWVGLTDEEIDAIYEQHHTNEECESVNWGYERAIEAKLKEKNT
jgi:lipoate-protein ligase A